jgi:hypothetical protein
LGSGRDLVLDVDVCKRRKTRSDDERMDQIRGRGLTVLDPLDGDELNLPVVEGPDRPHDRLQTEKERSDSTRWLEVEQRGRLTLVKPSETLRTRPMEDASRFPPPQMRYEVRAREKMALSDSKRIELHRFY